MCACLMCFIVLSISHCLSLLSIFLISLYSPFALSLFFLSSSSFPVSLRISFPYQPVAHSPFPCHHQSLVSARPSVSICLRRYLILTSYFLILSCVLFPFLLTLSLSIPLSLYLSLALSLSRSLFLSLSFDLSPSLSLSLTLPVFLRLLFALWLWYHCLYCIMQLCFKSPINHIGIS